MLNVYQITIEEHQVVDSWAADEISVLETLPCKYLEYISLILCNQQKLKSEKLTDFLFLLF